MYLLWYLERMANGYCQDWKSSQQLHPIWFDFTMLFFEVRNLKFHHRRRNCPISLCVCVCAYILINIYPVYIYIYIYVPRHIYYVLQVQYQLDDDSQIFNGKWLEITSAGGQELIQFDTKGHCGHKEKTAILLGTSKYEFLRIYNICIVFKYIYIYIIIYAYIQVHCIYYMQYRIHIFLSIDAI